MIFYFSLGTFMFKHVTNMAPIAIDKLKIPISSEVLKMFTLSLEEHIKWLKLLIYGFTILV